jgi:hypothetical protein
MFVHQRPRQPRSVSRFGDLKFEKKKNLVPENQVITANPEVTVHDITEEDDL